MVFSWFSVSLNTELYKVTTQSFLFHTQYLQGHQQRVAGGRLVKGPHVRYANLLIATAGTSFEEN